MLNFYKMYNTNILFILLHKDQLKMSNYFSDKQVNLLAEAKSSKKYIHLKNENQSLKDVMNLKNLNKMISMHNCWNQGNFSLVLDKNI